MIDYILENMQHDKPKELLCTDEAFTYYPVSIAGFYLMFRTNSHRPDGRRCYYLTNELAMCLGFASLNTMRCILPAIQYWRRFVSVQRLKVALKRYRNKQQHFADLLCDPTLYGYTPRP